MLLLEESNLDSSRRERDIRAVIARNRREDAIVISQDPRDSRRRARLVINRMDHIDRRTQDPILILAMRMNIRRIRIQPCPQQTRTARCSAHHDALVLPGTPRGDVLLLPLLGVVPIPGDHVHLVAAALQIAPGSAVPVRRVDDGVAAPDAGFRSGELLEGEPDVFCGAFGVFEKAGVQPAVGCQYGREKRRGERTADCLDLVSLLLLATPRRCRNPHRRKA